MHKPLACKDLIYMLGSLMQQTCTQLCMPHVCAHTYIHTH